RVRSGNHVSPGISAAGIRASEFRSCANSARPPSSEIAGNLPAPHAPPRSWARKPMTEPLRCYRHPNRETYVSCSECGRGICPDCMVFGPVGIRCPDHAKGAAAAPKQRAKVTARRLSAPVGLVTRILIGINVGVYLLELATEFREDLTKQLAQLATPAKAKLRINAAAAADRVTLNVTADTDATEAQTWLALFENGLASDVRTGENRGKRL